MKNGVQRLGAFAFAATAVISLAACGSNGSSGGDTIGSSGGDTIKLGHLTALTGPASSTGIPEGNAVQLAVDDINKAGGVTVGGKTYKIELDTQDDKSDPTAGVTAFQKIRSDGAKFMVGTESSSVLGAYLPIIKDDTNFITVIDGAAMDGVTGNISVYRPRVTLEQYTAGTVTYIQKQGFKSIALMTDSQHAGFVAETPGFVGDMKKIGVAVTTQESYKLGDTDYSAQLTAALKTKPDVINIRGFAPDAARIIKQARELGYNGPIISNSGIGKADIDQANAGSAMKGDVDIVAPYPADLIANKTYGAAAKKFVDAYEAKYQVAPGFLSASAYSAVQILVAAMEKAGTVDDVAKVRAALDKLTPADVTGLVDSVQPTAQGEIFTNHQADYQVATREYSATDGDMHATGFLIGG